MIYLFIYRNCVEWLIRLNRIIDNIKYGLFMSLKYAKLIKNPLKEDDNYRLYAYYLEDSVYRELVLWDIFRQLMNEFYQCGVDKHQAISIYKFIREQKDKIGDKRYNDLNSYLNTNEHKMIRETLRNSFTHSVDSMYSYIFHEKIDDKITVEPKYMFPNYPLENILYIINDFTKLYDFLLNIIEEIKRLRDDKFVLYNITSVMSCGKEYTDSDYWNYHNFYDNIEKIVTSCPDGCENSMLEDEKNVCKPILIKYKRIYDDEENYKIIEPSMGLSDLIKENNR